MTTSWTDDWYESASELPRLFVVVDRGHQLSLFDGDRQPVKTNPALATIHPGLIRLAQYVRWENGPEWKAGVVFDTLRTGDMSPVVRLPIPMAAWHKGVDDKPQYQRRDALRLALQADQYQRITRVLFCPTTADDALQQAHAYLFTDKIRQVNAKVPWLFDQTQDDYLFDDEL